MIRAELHAILGALACSLPQVALVLVCAAIAFASAGVVGDAVRRRRSILLVAAWVLGMVGVIARCLAFRSPAQLGAFAALPEPFSLAGLEQLASGERIPIAVAVTFGALLAAALWSCQRGRDISSADVFAEPSDRTVAIGALGEALVDSEPRDLGWPVLHNAILLDRAHSTEIDLLVRVSDGILVLEVKTWSGVITESEDAPVWTRRLRGGRWASVRNPVLPNLRHVRAVEAFVSDPAVRVRGFVVSAGHTNFAAEIAHAVVPLAHLRSVLQRHVAVAQHCQGAVDRAWSRLEAEAARSEQRETRTQPMSAHVKESALI